MVRELAQKHGTLARKSRLGAVTIDELSSDDKHEAADENR